MFTLVYLVRSTIMNLTTQDAQVECFFNVARHLEPGGFFVIEAIVPPWQRLPPGETVIPFDVSPAHLGFDGIDVATQNSWSHHYWFVDGETKTFSAPFRNVWPSEFGISWLALPGWRCAIGGVTGTASPTPARVAATSRSGRSPSSSAGRPRPAEEHRSKN